ncbi:hypothetical protein, partial [Paraburkholderia phenoliruptrix]|uniref:hypothetical protein n=1 Tax=Paraburkholderia phenoliruptrix TaxID=252970 RepID=UPI0034CD54B1
GNIHSHWREFHDFLRLTVGYQPASMRFFGVEDPQVGGVHSISRCQTGPVFRFLWFMLPEFPEGDVAVNLDGGSS